MWEIMWDSLWDSFGGFQSRNGSCNGQGLGCRKLHRICLPEALRTMGAATELATAAAIERAVALASSLAPIQSSIQDGMI